MVQLLAVTIVQLRPDRVGHVVSGCIFVLAFLTKQSALLVLIPILVWTVINGKGLLRWLLPAVALFGISVSVVLFTASSNGWFNFYIFQLPATHEIAWRLLVEFWRFDLLAPLPFGLAALFFLVLPGDSKSEQKEKWWLLTLAVAFIGSSFFARLHAGGWNNVLLPAYAMTAIIMAITFGRLFQKAEPKYKVLIYTICLLQFSLLIFDPGDHLPTEADQVAGDEFMAKLQQVGGEAWVPHHGWLVAAAGGGSCAQSMAMEDVFRGGNVKAAERLENEIRSYIVKGHWQMIVLDTPSFSEEIAKRYILTGKAIADSTAFWPVTGLLTRPELVYKMNER